MSEPLRDWTGGRPPTAVQLAVWGLRARPPRSWIARILGRRRPATPLDVPQWVLMAFAETAVDEG